MLDRIMPHLVYVHKTREELVAIPFWRLGLIAWVLGGDWTFVQVRFFR